MAATTFKIWYRGVPKFVAGVGVACIYLSRLGKFEFVQQINRKGIFLWKDLL